MCAVQGSEQAYPQHAPGHGGAKVQRAPPSTRAAAPQSLTSGLYPPPPRSHLESAVGVSLLRTMELSKPFNFQTGVARLISIKMLWFSMAHPPPPVPKEKLSPSKLHCLGKDFV